VPASCFPNILNAIKRRLSVSPYNHDPAASYYLFLEYCIDYNGTEPRLIGNVIATK